MKAFLYIKIIFISFVILFSCKKQKANKERYLLSQNIKTNTIKIIDTVSAKCVKLITKEIGKSVIFKNLSINNTHIPPDFKIQNNIIHIISRSDSDLVNYNIAKQEIEIDKQISILIKEYGGTPIALDVNEKFLVVQLNLGFLIFNKENKTHFLYKNRNEVLFQLKEDSIIIYNKDTNTISINVIYSNKQELKKVSEILVNVDYFSRFFCENDIIYFLDFTENILFSYSLNSKEFSAIKELNSLFEGYSFSLEDVYNNTLLLIMENNENADDIRVVKYNLNNDKIKVLDLASCLEASISNHQIIKDDSCDFDKPICSSFKFTQNGDIVVLYVFDDRLNIERIISL